MGRGRGGPARGAREPRRPIALIGLMGAGKTTVGRRLARALDRDFVDMDAWLARDAGMSVARQFATRGEADFRRREAALLATLAGRGDAPVVATGGGIVLAAANRRLLTRRFDTFWLDLGAREAWRRLGTAAGRPLLKSGPGGSPLARLVRVARERRPLYAASGRRIRVTGATAPALAARIASRVSAMRRPVARTTRERR